MAKIRPYDGRHDDQVATLVELMHHKMAEHSYKGEWSGISLQALVDYLDSEVAELKAAIADNNVFESMREAGDVGVCLVMIAETLMRSRTLTPSVIRDVRNRMMDDENGI